MPDPAFLALSDQLCPWLTEPLSKLETALAESRLGHAWLIAGPSGVGKLNLALAFAVRLLHGRSGAPPPLALTPSAAVAAMHNRHQPGDHHPDLHWLHPEEDKKTIGIEQVRDTTEVLALKAFRGTAKVVLIEPAEAMTPSAANALLKSLEEPNPDTYMLLISHQPGRLPSTIRSRCQTLAIRGPHKSGEAADTGARLSRAEAAPLLSAQRKDPQYVSFINELDETIKLISEHKQDPQASSDAWRKGDLNTILDWLIGRLQRAIRMRVLQHGSNRVTEPTRAVLHNHFDALTLDALFAQLESVERLRDQHGGGINVELALSALLLGFQPERG